MGNVCNEFSARFIQLIPFGNIVHHTHHTALFFVFFNIAKFRKRNIQSLFPEHDVLNRAITGAFIFFGNAFIIDSQIRKHF